MFPIAGEPLIISKIAGLTLTKIVGGVLFRSAVCGGVCVFLTLATSRSSEIVIVAAGFRNVRTCTPNCSDLSGGSDGNVTLVICGLLRKTVCVSKFTLVCI